MNYPKKLKEKAQDKIANCNVEGFLSGNGNENANIMFVGEAPGKNEIITHKPFTGRAGEKLDENLKQINLTRDDIYITSTVRSRPYKKMPDRTIANSPNRKPNQKEINAHAILLDYEIETVDPLIIATLGDTALKRLTGKKFKLALDHGKLLKTPIYKYDTDKYILTTNSYYIVPLYHPAAVFYNPKLKNIISNDFDNLKSYLLKLT